MQRKVLITTTYNEMGVIIDTKAEEVASQTCNQLATDTISRQAVNILVDELARAISDERCCISRGRSTATIMQDILDLPPVNPQKNIVNNGTMILHCEPQESEGQGMNKESSIKQLKRIKQDMTHADDVNALGFAIRFMENGVSEIEFDQLVFALATMYKAPENAPADWEHHGEENLKAWKDYINTSRKRGYIKE